MHALTKSERYPPDLGEFVIVNRVFIKYSFIKASNAPNDISQIINGKAINTAPVKLHMTTGKTR